MADEGTLHRVAAFAEQKGGGNPAGVWIGEVLPAAQEMQRVAAEVGFSETAFVAPASGTDRSVRYYSPEAEVSFCGHATIAAGYVLGGGDEATTYRFSTQVGEVPVTVTGSGSGTRVSLTSVDPRYKPAPDSLVDEVLPVLAWRRDELDASIPPALAYAGAWHLVLAAGSERRLSHLDYDLDALRSIMLREDLTTLQLIWRESDASFHSRNPFPVGGVVEDPATGAAAAALGGYLREAGIIQAPASFVIRQGEAMGRPSVLAVDVPTSGGISVSGSAVTM